MELGAEQVEARAKSSQRINYEAQIEVIKNQIGSLEGVRERLGLSARKMTQILMVDPSAWTRWTKSGGQAPPHVWRALQLYMIVQEKIPGLSAPYFIGKDAGVSAELSKKKIEELEAQIAELRIAVKANRITAIMLGLAALIVAAAFWRMLG